MDKINFENLPSTKTPVSAENLNAMQTNAEKVGNYIGSTQPSTGENVWIKKGKNLIDMSKIFALGTFNNNTGAVVGRADVTLVSADSTTVVFKSSASWSGIVYFADVLPNTEYTYKFETDQPDNDYVLVEGYNNTGEHTRRILQNGQEENTFTTNSNEYKIGICIETTTLLNTNITISNLQLEQNSTATSYEPYIEKEILVKKDNGVFEKFLNADDLIFLFGEGIRSNPLASGRCKYYKFNKMVCLVFSDIIANQSLGNNTILFSGLPGAKATGTFILQSYSEFYQTRCRIDGSGNVSIHYSSMEQGGATRQYYGMFIYETI